MVFGYSKTQALDRWGLYLYPIYTLSMSDKNRIIENISSWFLNK